MNSNETKVTIGKKSNDDERLGSLIDSATLMNDKLMTMVFDENIPATKLLIDVILNRDIEVITTKAQWDIQSSTPEGHNIRLDIYAKEANGEDLGDGSHIIYVNGAYRGNDPLGRLMQDLNNQGTEGFNYKVCR